jgi:hypothetical protein
MTSPYALTDYTLNTTVVSDFTIDPDYCLALTLNQDRHLQTIELLPNPATDAIRVRFPVEQTLTDLSIFDTDGKQVLIKNTSTINVSLLKPGLYFIKLKTDKGEFSQKFIKE